MSPARAVDNGPLDEIEGDPVLWLAAVLPGYFFAPLAPHHLQLWEWVDAIRRYRRSRPFIGVWNRGGAKSTSAEAAVVKLGSVGQRRYCLYLSRTQDQANDHVETISGMLESPDVEAWYPYMSERLVGKWGRSRGWSRTRLRTASGFTVDALGLDSAARGAKVDQDRPDLIVFDDIDDEMDGVSQVAKLEKLITRKVLPAGSPDLAVLGIQNLLHDNGVFARLVDGRADYLNDRIVCGPVPAVVGLETQRVETNDPDPAAPQHRDVIVAGTPTWSGMDLDVCQEKINEWGLSAFLTEAQHDTEPPPGGMFSHLDWNAYRVTPEQVPEIIRMATWCDPAVTATDQSDSHGVVVGGLGIDSRLYVFFAWEQRASPTTALTVAITHAIDYGCTYIGVETDQGGDTWESVVAQVKQAVIAEALVDGRTDLAEAVGRLTLRQQKAGPTQQSKQARAQRHLLPHYEGDRIRHVTGTTTILERSLYRFPLMKPFDLTDAAVWLARDLLMLGAGGSSADLLRGRKINRG